MKSRPYQKEAEDATINVWKEGKRKALVVMPTGTGKTILFASIIRRTFPRRAMVLAHRQELVWQAREKIKKVTGLTVDVEMGEYKAQLEAGLFHPKSSVIVSSIQTQTSGGDGGGRLGRFDPNDFGLLIIDEAHHATAASYRRVLDYYMSNPNLVVLGVTATPDRSDEEALGQIFDEVSYDYEILDAINDGWLVPVEQQLVSIESLNFEKINTVAGDLNQSQLDAEMNSERNLYGIASATIDIVGNRRGIGFAASVRHAQRLSEIFNRHKTGMAAVVSAKTDKDERKKIISDFSKGKIQWLWNCGVFTEGFDDSGVEIIAMGRPTKSRALYAQMAGRGTRPHETISNRLNDAPAAVVRRMMIDRSIKPSCLIIDFVGNSGKHKLMTTADILGGKMSEQAIENARIEARRAGRPVRMDKVIEEEEKKLEEQKKRKEEQEARRAKLIAKADYKTQRIDPFDILAIKPTVSRGWDKGKELTPNQKNFLIRWKYDPEAMDYARAKQLIGIIMDRIKAKKCTIPQAALLEKFGYSKLEASEMSYEKARESIDAIAKNGWKRPTNSVEDSSGSAGANDDDNIPF